MFCWYLLYLKIAFHFFTPKQFINSLKFCLFSRELPSVWRVRTRSSPAPSWRSTYHLRMRLLQEKKSSPWRGWKSLEARRLETNKGEWGYFGVAISTQQNYIKFLQNTWFLVSFEKRLLKFFTKTKLESRKKLKQIWICCWINTVVCIRNLTPQISTLLPLKHTG